MIPPGANDLSPASGHAMSLASRATRLRSLPLSLPHRSRMTFIKAKTTRSPNDSLGLDVPRYWMATQSNTSPQAHPPSL
ncbi:hypothetical protein CEP54_008921 [Fusarium duplospermum]|uniref:Uncharacterized protein n=1 Tax=Fusarium duplospermum TaxID=1325734 RepID=A0A428PTD3_9HYPO|nr:hypothetical protein CEP54_008921 [Fusarium duplospermum]